MEFRKILAKKDHVQNALAEEGLGCPESKLMVPAGEKGKEVEALTP